MHLEKYELWLLNVEDETILGELKAIGGDETEIKNRFFKDLEFGTGGLRGILGAGSNYMNTYTVGRATQGIANDMVANGLKRAVVSYDSRKMSEEFARLVFEIFTANGIECFITRELTPTPFLSFCVRSLNADMGVMITASHNPGQYNGYKVYDRSGCQLANQPAERIMESINRVDIFKDIKRSVGAKLNYVPDAVEEEYLKCVLAQSINEVGEIKIVYTPLNGAGYRMCPKLLKQRGVKNLIAVEPQSMPSGEFSTCPYPNPEIKEALLEGLKEMKKHNADLLIATDPDADRMGLAEIVDGEEVLLSGNQTGALLMDYILGERAKKGILAKDPVVIKTIVSTNLCTKIAQKYGAEIRNVLTGFKYIGGQINILEGEGREDRFIFGFEESYGYLSGTYARDKDALVASSLAVEMASKLKAQGKKLTDRLNELYEEFGYYLHKLLNFEFKGAEGFMKMRSLMDDLRNNPPKEIGGLRVEKITDYMQFVAKEFPLENVLVYSLLGGAEVIVRPSGTEPKLKAYLTATGDLDGANAVLSTLTEAVNKIILKE